MRKLILYLTSALSLGALSAVAADIPKYDPEGYCKTVADVSGGSSMIYSGCIDMEQTSYNKLKTDWSAIAPTTINYCDEVAQMSGGSYSLLEGCIDMENDATANTKSFKF